MHTAAPSSGHTRPDRSLSNRDAALLALRPTLPAEERYAEATPGVPLRDDLEAFQTRTLRPLLKLQNPLLLALVADHLARTTPGFPGFAPADQEAHLVRMLRQDARFKRTLYGFVAGLCTEPEFAFFLRHRAEVRRRMLALVTERLRSQTGTLAEAVRVRADRT
ncbi:MAG: hypothetical protein AAF809_09370 [Bacteroidota bacterium]